MSGRVVYLNGEYVPEAEARISIFDSALMYGDMLFEMTRSFRQRPYRLRDHLERLYDSLSYVEIDCGLSIDDLERVTGETIERNLPELDGRDFQIMHNVTRGGMALYEEIVKEGTKPVVTINIFPLIRHIGGMAEKFEEGAPLRRAAAAVGAGPLHRPQGQEPQPHILQDRRVAGGPHLFWGPGAPDR